VFAIQAVLSGVRGSTTPANLSENVTQIITIVTSIVAICKDNFPPASAVRGGEILQELSEHADHLSEAQSSREPTKEERQIMAKSSYAVANMMKELAKL
jgi:protein SPA2